MIIIIIILIIITCIILISIIKNNKEEEEEEWLLLLFFYQNWPIDLGGGALTRTHGRTEGRTCAKQITPHYSDECINEYIN